ncbi:MAG: hydrogenase maturation protease [Candidatus Obscuribacterales bacterium]|nr:hydrogenase maturation protease [Candidatus Obscuribacterales bacterium]
MHKQCDHSVGSEPAGLVIITIGNPLRADDGIAAALCNALPLPSLQGVCRFDLGVSTSRIGECLAGHKAAIIIDATCIGNGTGPGTVTLVDLNAAINKRTPMEIKSCHGFSLFDELRLAKTTMELPKRMILFGVEVADTQWCDSLSQDLKGEVPALAKGLSKLVQRIMETLNKDA